MFREGYFSVQSYALVKKCSCDHFTAALSLSVYSDINFSTHAWMRILYRELSFFLGLNAWTVIPL